MDRKKKNTDAWSLRSVKRIVSFWSLLQVYIEFILVSIMDLFMSFDEPLSQGHYF